jgi:hypothetical protein
MGKSRNALVSGNAFDHDAFAWQLADRLLEDFKPFVAPSFYDAAKSASVDRNVGEWRALACGDFDSFENPFTMKASYQVTSLFKKFSFSQDLLTPEQLKEDSKRKFLANQERLRNHVIPTDDPLVRDVIWRARGWAERILGDFHSVEICERATFGKKSSVGIPMRDACEGARLEAPITGSDDHIDWFQHYYGAWNRPALEYARGTAARGNTPLFRSVDVLEAVLVPKTWKSLRMIMPNTTIGTLYSSGLGRTLEDRLRAFGHDIKHLQPVHRDLARLGSLTSSLVTADQSMASDNITVDLVKRILPWRWANALCFGRIQRISLYGETIDSPTFATMGIGFTFPLQTLLFLVLLLAIRDIQGLDEATVVSVFGDDLVYATEMHPLVVDVFPKLGLVLNLDKTFADGHFRESCGGDYFRGIDVRPFLLGEADGKNAHKRRAEAYLYKTLNALLRRWNVFEVPQTCRFIVEEIRGLRGKEPLVVPPDFPDTAGIKHDVTTLEELGLRAEVRRDVHGTVTFKYLAFEPDARSEHRHAPYLFLRLRTEPRVEKLPFPVKGIGDVLAESTPIFKWEPDPARGSFRSETTGRRHRYRLAMIPQQDRGRYRERVGVTGHWTP